MLQVAVVLIAAKRTSVREVPSLPSPFQLMRGCMKALRCLVVNSPLSAVRQLAQTFPLLGGSTWANCLRDLSRVYE